MFHEKIFAVAQVLDQLVLLVLIIMSVVSVGMILERFFVLRKLMADSQKARARIGLALQSNTVEDFEDIAKDPSTLEGRAASYSLRYLKESGGRGVEEFFNAFILSEKPEIEKRLGFLATVGSNAPYIGLFGTVLGIMKAFQDLSTSPEAGQQTVMAGISMALVATATGLFVAIPAVIFFNYYSKQVKSLFVGLEAVKELCLAYSKKKGQ